MCWGSQQWHSFLRLFLGHSRGGGKPFCRTRVRRDQVLPSPAWAARGAQSPAVAEAGHSLGAGGWEGGGGELPGLIREDRSGAALPSSGVGRYQLQHKAPGPHGPSSSDWGPGLVALAPKYLDFYRQGGPQRRRACFSGSLTGVRVPPAPWGHLRRHSLQSRRVVGPKESPHLLHQPRSGNLSLNEFSLFLKTKPGPKGSVFATVYAVYAKEWSDIHGTPKSTAGDLGRSRLLTPEMQSWVHWRCDPQAHVPLGASVL